MAFLEWVLDVALKIVKIGCAWLIIKFMVKYGKSLFADLLETTRLETTVFLAKRRKRNLRYLIKEAEENGAPKPEETEDPNDGKVEARIL